MADSENKVYVHRWALDEEGAPHIEITEFVRLGTHGTSEDDPRGIHLPGQDGKWFFSIMRGSFFGDEISDTAKQDPKHVFWYGPFRQGPILAGLRLVDEATHAQAVENKANQQKD